MGESIFHTALPVEGFVYSPFIATLFALFVPLGLDTSLLLWGILQGVFILLYLALFRRLLPTRQWIQLLFAFLTLSSFPLLHNLAWGQVGIVTTVSILGALYFYERGQRAIAAVLLAFGLSFKFFPLIFLLPFVIRRDFRFLLYSVSACGVLLLVVPASLLGMDGATRFYTALLDAYRQMDWVIANYNSQHFPHVLLRVLGAIGADGYAYLPLLRWIGYTLAVANVGLICLIERAHLHQANLWSFHILFLSIPFILPTSWPVDLVYLPFGQALIAWQVVDREKRTSGAVTTQGQSPTSQVIATLLLLTSVIISNIVFFNLVGNRTLYGSAGSIFWANVLLLTASCVVLVPAALGQIRRIPANNPPHMTTSTGRIQWR